MKKIIAVTLLVTCLFEAIMVHSDNADVFEEDVLIELNIIDQSYFSNPNTVTRAECIVAIMRVIGVTDDEIEKLNGSDLISFADTDAFSYFGCAYLAKIAYGEECIVDYSTLRNSYALKNTDFFFSPDRAVTVNETLTFMVRCLENMKPEDFQLSVARAKLHGLITDEDLFIKDNASAINQKDFCTLLKRMLQQKRYKYYGRADNRFKMEGNIDDEQIITYLEFLTQRSKK